MDFPRSCRMALILTRLPKLARGVAIPDADGRGAGCGADQGECAGDGWAYVLCAIGGFASTWTWSSGEQS